MEGCRQASCCPLILGRIHSAHPREASSIGRTSVGAKEQIAYGFWRRSPWVSKVVASKKSPKKAPDFPGRGPGTSRVVGPITP